jgi:hypothetical protein
MMEQLDAEAVLRAQRNRYKAAVARADRIRSRAGAQTATRRKVFVDKSDRPFAFLFDGADPDDVIRDSRAIKNILTVFKSPLGRRGVGRDTTSTVQLPSGKSFVINRYTGEVSRP